MGRSNWPYYAAASFVAGAVILGAGYYYFFDSGPDEVVLLPYGDDDFYDREDFVRNLNEDGTIPSNFTMHDPPTYSSELWAAVSISTDGAYSGSWDYESAEAAAEDVTRRCRAASRDPERCNTAVSTGWVQGVRCFRQNADGTWNSRAAVGSGATAPEAMSDAFQSALRDGRFHISECKDRIAIGAHGEHRKYKE